MHYWPLHVGDWIKATAHLSATEVGIYVRLLNWYYDKETPLPHDGAAVMRIACARSDDEKSAVLFVLGEFFLLGDGGYRNHRADKEIELLHEKSDKAKASAEARWAREKQRLLQKQQHNETGSNANAMRTHSEGNANGMLPAPRSPLPDLHIPPIVPQGGQSADADAPASVVAGKTKRRKAVSQKKTLSEWLAVCVADGRKPIPDDDTIRTWAKDAGIPDDYMALAWRVFRRDWQTKKPQADWPATFRDAIRRNWLKLWYFDQQGEAQLTTAGHQEMRSNG